jgi:uncharacterized membrane protein YphA (DoxX/SURF4 family)
MAQVTQAGGQTEPARSRAMLFGVPIGELGWFASLLIGAALGFCAFFLATFAGIVSIMIYNSVTHANVDLADSYMRGGIPAGVIVLLLAWGYLGKLWVSRITAR